MEKYKEDLFTRAFSKDKPLSPKNCRKLFKRICRGVRDLHRSGVAHLDIKPENILIDEKGKPFLCDFGSSFVFKKQINGKIISRKARSTVKEALKARGTKIYAAPEVYQSAEYNPFSADVYSLGVLLFVLVSALFPSSNPDGSIDLTPLKKQMNHRGYSLLASLVDLKPENRPTIESVLACKWFEPHNKGKESTLSLIVKK